MVAHLEQRVLDFGLNVLDTNATDIVVCGTEPTTYAQANATYMLGRKVFAAGGAFGSPADAANGRKVSSTVISDGTILTTGTASWWAVIDTTGASLHAVGLLSSPQAVTATNTFTLGTFDITIPAHA